ncbi:MAG: ATP synthase F1 subunit delta [Terriglobia bacterium]
MPMAIAQRYARGLAEAAGAQKDYSGITKALEAFAGIYRESAELREVFDSPAVFFRQKNNVLAAILDRLQVPAIAGNFLHVLLAHYRLNLLDEIRNAFQRLANERLGIVQMTLVSASPLSVEQQEALRESFGEITQQKVDVKYQVDPSLLGGAKAQIRSTVYDGTVRGYLDRIRERLEV